MVLIEEYLSQVNHAHRVFGGAVEPSYLVGESAQRSVDGYRASRFLGLRMCCWSGLLAGNVCLHIALPGADLIHQ